MNFNPAENQKTIEGSGFACVFIVVLVLTIDHLLMAP